MEIHDIWGDGLRAGSPLYIMLKKFRPSELLKLPYSVKPSSGVVNDYRSVLERLSGGIKDPATGIIREEMWVYQYVPVRPYSLLSGTETQQKMIRDLTYVDERGLVREAKLYKIGVVEYDTGGVLGAFDPMPFSCFNTAALMNSNMVPVIVDCVSEGRGG